MKKTAIVVLLALVALLVIAGCNTQAQSSSNNKQYYVPSAGGCGVAGPTPTASNVAMATSAESVDALMFF